MVFDDRSEVKIQDVCQLYKKYVQFSAPPVPKPSGDDPPNFEKALEKVGDYELFFVVIMPSRFWKRK